MEEIKRGFHLMAKPVGARCNLRCQYCFYIEKKNFYALDDNYRMSHDVLEAYIHQYIHSQDIPEISFVWQGGEPMLAGLDFYRKVIKFQRRYAGGKSIQNSIQTNGTLLDEEWCEFLREHQFLVGISIDGPSLLHDRYRVDALGKGTFRQVVQGIQLLNQYQVPYNALVCVSQESSGHGADIYQFLKSLGVIHMQFTPLIERKPVKQSKQWGLHFSAPAEETIEVTDFTVDPKDYGTFLIDVFEEWMKGDVGAVFINNIEAILPVWMGLPPTLCTYTQNCGECLIIEHNGDIYSCDHFMYPQYRLGNILEQNLAQIARSKQQQAFGRQKSQCLHMNCQICELLPICGGGCPKHRFVKSGDGEGGVHYMCKGYQRFYRHIHPYMKAIIQLIQGGMPVKHVMELKHGSLAVVSAPGKRPADTVI